MPENLWPELSHDARAQIDNALARGNKIEAIKLYRNATGAGLKEAKDAIERGESKDDVINRRGGSSFPLIVAAIIFLAIVLAIVIFLRSRSR